MMLSYHSRSAFQKLDPAQNLLAMHWMFAHPDPLLIRQFRGFPQDSVRYADLADVVQQRAELQGFHLRRAQTIFASQSETESHHAFRMSVRFGIARLEGGG